MYFNVIIHVKLSEQQNVISKVLFKQCFAFCYRKLVVLCKNPFPTICVGFYSYSILSQKGKHLQRNIICNNKTYH